MFETLFSRPFAIQRHRSGPFAVERTSYLEQLAAQGTPPTTMRIRAHYCLHVARELENWPLNHQFTPAEIDTMATAWAAQSVASERASTPKNPQRMFRMTAVAFLRFHDRFHFTPTAVPGRYADRIEAFIKEQREYRWQSDETCRVGRGQVVAFLSYLEEQGCDLANIDVGHVDVYFQHITHRLSRMTLRNVVTGLRAWLRFCEAQGWTQSGLADAILLPRIYQHERLPLGPTWDQVSRIIDEASGDDPASLRNRAILLLLSVYGLRSGEVRRLQLDDVDWQYDRLRVQRSKSRRVEIFPLEPSVGNAMASYLRHGRPPSQHRTLFLTLRAPYRALSDGALRRVVRRYLSIAGLPAKGCGPHGLRHACARHLLDAGYSFKEVGDHLGHRSPDSTGIYVKVNLTGLRQVAFETLGGLA
jgi:site-specific recombinase XerD